MAFKASGSDDILRVDKGTVTSAQWSRAARGYMLKLLTATNVYKFCGFQESVSLLENSNMVLNSTFGRRTAPNCPIML